MRRRPRRQRPYAANYLQYRAIFAAKCKGKPVTETPIGPSRMSMAGGRGPKRRGRRRLLSQRQPARKHAGVREERLCTILQGQDGIRQAELRWTLQSALRLQPLGGVHSRRRHPPDQQSGMPGVYAYSVDDAVGNLNVYATGYIVDIGSTKHLENQRRAAPEINISYGYAPGSSVNFVTYGVCGNDPYLSKNQSIPPTPSLSSTLLSEKVVRCTSPTTRTRRRTAYTFTVTAAPPFTIIPTADVKKNLASWSGGNGQPHEIQHDQRHRL